MFDMPTLKQMLRIAVPSTLQQSIISFGTLFLQALINSYGSSVVAGYTAAIKIDGFASTPLMSIGNAMSIYAAQNIGANNPERIKKGYRAAWYMVFTIFVLTVLVSLVFGRQLIGMFIDGTPDDLMMWAGLNYLVWISFCSILRGGMLTTNGVLRGAKDIKVFTASTLSNFFIRVIFSYLLAPYIGVSAVWIALPIGLSTGLLISLIRYFTGGWKKKAFAQFE